MYKGYTISELQEMYKEASDMVILYNNIRDKKNTIYWCKIASEIKQTIENTKETK